ncbi:MAG: hypothetical protein ABSC61_09035 [Anaerolineales bacterium]
MKKYQPTGIVPAGIVLLTLVAYGLRVVGAGSPSSLPPADWPSRVAAGATREYQGWFYN